MPQKGPEILVAASTKSVPMIGPVQENDTNTRVNAMKKIPTYPPLSDFASILLTKELGNVISKAPKNDIAKIRSNKKNAKLNHTLVERECKAPAPNISVTPNPKATYNIMIEIANKNAFLIP